MEELVRYARALLLLQLKQMEMSAVGGQGPAIRAEILLAEAGFGPREIADLLSKNYGAVAKALSRARAIKPRGAPKEKDSTGVDDGE